MKAKNVSWKLDFQSSEFQKAQFIYSTFSSLISCVDIESSLCPRVMSRDKITPTSYHFVRTITFPHRVKYKQVIKTLCLLGRLGVRQLRQTAAFKRTKELFSSFGTCRIYDNVRLTCQQVPLSDKLFLVYILETLYLLVVAQRQVHCVCSEAHTMEQI